LDYLKKLDLCLRSLVVFRRLLDDSVIAALANLIRAALKREDGVLDAYAECASLIYGAGGNLTAHIWRRISADENAYIVSAARGESADEELKRCALRELAGLAEAASVTGGEIKLSAGLDACLPVWRASKKDFAADYSGQAASAATRGYGVFSEYLFFSAAGGALRPVKSPDAVRMAELKGYHRERGIVADNTVALLEGRPAANALLYGDAGTGKSSTVKAIVNEYGPRGLRLVEIKKGGLDKIPDIAERLAGNPLKFILFIDDLSFAGDNEEIGALKAMLEGGVSARPGNVAVYATSNRRHLVRESFSERGGDDIHLNETMQEKISLSDRFGLTVNFSKPGREQYLEIVRGLAEWYGLPPRPGLDAEAERYALERGARSPRFARQFVDMLRRREKGGG
jgi:predicted AAA+ superfamily ATPase